MEPSTLWRRITRSPSPRQRVALHSRALGSAGDMSGSAPNHSRAVWDKQHLLWERCRWASNSWLRLIVQRFLKLMYSGCIVIYVSMYLYSYQSTDGKSGLAAGGAWERFEVRPKMMIEWTQRCTGRLWSSEFGDALGGRARVNWEMHLEAVIDRVQRCTGRPWSSEFGDALGGRDGVNPEMHLEAVIEWVWTCTGRPRWTGLRDALWGRDRASLDMHLEAEIVWTQRCTLRPWSSESGHALGGRDGMNSEMHFEAMIE